MYLFIKLIIMPCRPLPILLLIQAVASSQRIGRLFQLVETYAILANYSQPFAQSTSQEMVGFVAALGKVGDLNNGPLMVRRGGYWMYSETVWDTHKYHAVSCPTNYRGRF